MRLNNRKRGEKEQLKEKTKSPVFAFTNKFLVDFLSLFIMLRVL